MTNDAIVSPVFVAKDLFENRFRGADAILLAGSVVRGEASKFSDLDLIVFYSRVECSRLESFFHREWPVEALIHDSETMRYWVETKQLPIGDSTLADMILEGLEVPGPTDLTREMKAWAQDIVKMGPPDLDAEEIARRRYQISALCDDLREPRSKIELLASGAVLFSELADFYLRTRGQWSGRGKNVLRRLKRFDAAFSRRYSEAFEDIFDHQQTRRALDVTSEILSPHGGPLFAGYRQDSPVTWRRART
jgi:hypothetical protein